MPKNTFFYPEQRRSADAVIVTFLGYSDAVKLQRRSTAAVKLQRPSIAAVINTTALWPNILGYSNAAQLQRRSTDAATKLVLRCCVYWPNRLGWRQKVLHPPSTFMLLSCWCPLGHGKWYLPAIQFLLAVRLIPILTHLSSRWTVPLKPFYYLSLWCK
jgi:hypothetical protein